MANFKRNHLQAEVPGELPDNLVDELMDEGATYWWNANTGEGLGDAKGGVLEEGCG